MGWHGSVQTGANAGEPDRVQAGNRRFPFTRLNDETGQHETITAWDSTEDMLEAMQMVNPATGKCYYDTDAAFRISVHEIAANSPALLSEPSLNDHSPIPDNATMLQGMKEDALRQRREQLIDEAGGGNLIAKYELAKSLMDSDFYEAAHEMQAATEHATPYADYLKGRAAAGLGPERFSIETEDLPKEKTLEERASEMHLDNSFVIDVGGN